MPEFNLDILRIVAQHLPKDPINFTRLATVNRDFYHVFTSDSLWRGLDFYGIKTNIFRHFMSKAIDCKDRAYPKLFSSDVLAAGCLEYLDEQDNLYAWYNYLLKHTSSINSEIWTKMFFECRELVYLVAETVTTDIPLASALRMSDKRFAVIQYAKNPKLFKTKAPDEHKNDRELIKELLPLAPEIYAYLNTELRREEEILGLALVVSIMKDEPFDEPVTSAFLRKSSLAVGYFRVNPGELSEHPEFQDNMEVARAVVEYSGIDPVLPCYGIAALSDRIKHSEKLLEYALEFGGHYLVFFQNYRTPQRRLKRKAGMKLSYENIHAICQSYLKHYVLNGLKNLFDYRRALEAALEVDGRLLQFAKKEAQESLEFCKMAIESEIPCFRAVRNWNRPAGRELALLWLDHSKKLNMDIGEAYNQLHDEDKCHPEVRKAFLSKRYCAAPNSLSIGFLANHNISFQFKYTQFNSS